MSLINQMLSDLEARRPGRPADSERALEGLQAAAADRPAPRSENSLVRFLAAAVIGAVAASGMWYGLKLIDPAPLQRTGGGPAAERLDAAAGNGEVAGALIASNRGAQTATGRPSSVLGNERPTTAPPPDAADSAVFVSDTAAATGPAGRSGSAASAHRSGNLDDVGSWMDTPPELAEPKLIVNPANEAVDDPGRTAGRSVETYSDVFADIEQPAPIGEGAIEAHPEPAKTPYNGAEALNHDQAVEYAGTMHMQARAEEDDRARQLSKALELSRRGEDADALIVLADLVDRHPDFSAAREAYARELLRRNDVRTAERILRTGLALNPKAHRHAQMLAHLLVDQGANEAALELLLTAAPEIREDVEYHAFIAALQQRSGQHDAAIRGYSEILSLAPKHGVWWMGLGISLAAKNHASQAQQAFQRALVDRQLSDNLRQYANREISRLAGNS